MNAQIIEKIAALLTAAFGFVAALAWNNAISTIMQKYLQTGDGEIGMLVYAVIVTVVAVIITVYIGKLADKAKN